MPGNSSASTQGMSVRQTGGQHFIPSGGKKAILDAPLMENAAADSSLAATGQLFPAGKY